VIQELLDHAKFEFELDRPLKGGEGSLRDHLEAAEKMAPGASKGELDNPTPVPTGLDYLWTWFLELSFTGRTYGQFGAMPISNTELLAWSQLNQVQLRPWELRAMRLLDTAWLASRRPKNG
jgi:hypothetical protein